MSSITMLPILEKIYAQKHDKDLVILSAGHAGLAQYVLLEKLLNVDAEQMYHDFGIHPHRDPSRGIHASGGSLGTAILIAAGFALADRNRTVYCLLSDGECAEGSVWEALSFAKRENLINLSIHVNANGYGAYDAVDRDELEGRIIAFCPWATVHKTINPDFDHLRGLEGHYHIIKTEEEKRAMTAFLSAASCKKN